MSQHLAILFGRSLQATWKIGDDAVRMLQDAENAGTAYEKTKTEAEMEQVTWELV